MPPLLFRKRQATTLVELIIYLALTIVIVLGLSSITARLRQAEQSGSIKSDVQQSLRAAVQQLSSLSQNYQTGTIVGGAMLLWNVTADQTQPPPQTYVQVWLDVVDGAVYTQSFVNGIAQNDKVRLTPASMRITQFDVGDSTGTSSVPVFSVNIAAEDSSVSPNVRNQDEWNFTSAIHLRPASLNIAAICCPAYLTSCPVGMPVCKNEACFANGADADNLLGQSNYASSTPDKGGSTGPEGFSTPNGVAIDATGHRLFVADTANHRVLMFALDANNAIDDYTADAVYGQNDSFTANNPGTSATAMVMPEGIAFNRATNQLFVADTGNNRVLVFDNDSNTTADAVFGQNDSFTGNSPETSATEMNSPTGIAFDYLGQRIFIADKGNNRVLAFNGFAPPDTTADNVLGQINFDSSGYGTGINQMDSPQTVAFGGNQLIVADTNNNRVLTFTGPSFSNGRDATHVLGAASVSPPPPDASHFAFPKGIAYDEGNQRIIVADSSNNRVLFFSGAATGIVDGMNATHVLGQSNFNSGGPDTNEQGFTVPIGLAYDELNVRLFVSDRDNHRVLQFNGGKASCSGGPVFVSSSSASSNPAGSSSSSTSSQPNGLSCDLTPDDCIPYFDAINDDIDSLASTTYDDDYLEQCTANKVSIFDLEDTPVGFTSAETVKIRVAYYLNEGLAAGLSNPSGFKIRILSGTLLSLTNEVSHLSLFDTGWQVKDFPPLTITGTNDKNTWDNAKISIESTGAAPSVKISAIEVELTQNDTLSPQADYDPPLSQQWPRVGGPACAASSSSSSSPSGSGGPSSSSSTTSIAVSDCNPQQDPGEVWATTSIIDIDGDGDSDIIGMPSGSSSDHITFYKNVTVAGGPIIFDTAGIQSAGPSAGYTDIVTGNFNNDSHIDVALYGYGSSQTSVYIFLGDGNGDFTYDNEYPIQNAGPLSEEQRIAVADVNGDCKEDVFVLTANGDVFVLTNDGLGNGDFVPAINVINADSAATSLNVGDIDSDGAPDIAYVTKIGSTEHIALHINQIADSYFQSCGPPAPSLSFSAPTNFTADDSDSFLLADADADADLDLIYDRYPSNTSVEVRKNDGSGVFGSASSYSLGFLSSYSYRLYLTSINNDSYPDIVVGTFHDGEVPVLLGQSSGSFADPPSPDAVIYDTSNALASWYVATGDFNADGFADFYNQSRVSFDYTVYITENNGGIGFDLPTVMQCSQ